MSEKLQKKLSLLNDLNINTFDDKERVENVYYFDDEVAKIILNGVYMLIPVDSLLIIILQYDSLLFKIENKKPIFIFEIDYNDIIDFNLILRDDSLC